MLKRIIAGVIVALIMVPAVAAAETAQGFYLGSRSGWSVPGNETNGGDFGGETYKDGYAVMGAIGYALSIGLRFELEGAYRSNDLEQVSTSVFFWAPVPATGEIQSATGMLNAYFDLDLGLPVNPFVGAGLGMGSIWFNATVPSTGEVQARNNSVMAIQGTAGVSFPISSRVVVDLAYTYFASARLFSGLGQSSYDATVGLRLFF